MQKRQAIGEAIKALVKEGHDIAMEFQAKKDKPFQFQYKYQDWYTKSLKIVADIALDRLAEFRGYYEIDAKRKTLGYGTFVIQDYIKNVAPNAHIYPNFDSREQVLLCFMNQISILRSIGHRASSLLASIQGELFAEIQENEIEVARELTKVSLRAAGAIIGVVIEGHLQKVAVERSVKVTKKHPTIADLSEGLKAASVIDVPTWRKISYLADLRNICCHKKDVEPTKDQLDELIQGAEWLTKNVY